MYVRLAEPRLAEALADSPVVLVHGPRQCGKTTLARTLGARLGHAYVTLDDDVVLAEATADPVGFVGDLPSRATIDEVQRAPAIFAALKSAVDRDCDGGEVDVVLERGAGRVAGVEVKASATVTAPDFRGLRRLREAAGSRFAGGVVLYDGEACVPFGDGFRAVPIRRLWEA